MEMIIKELEHVADGFDDLRHLLTRIFELYWEDEHISPETVLLHRCRIKNHTSRVYRIIAQLAQKYEVQQYSLCEGWANNWSIEEDGISKPVVFDTEEQAQQALEDFFQEMVEEIASGNSDYHRDEFRIRPVAQD